MNEKSLKLYVASKAYHYDMWKNLREGGLPIISTWIDEGGLGQSGCMSDLWIRCIKEASECDALILYCAVGDCLRGALLEVGAALANKKPIYATGVSEGTYHNHPLFHSYGTLHEAITAALTPKGDA